MSKRPTVIDLDATPAKRARVRSPVVLSSDGVDEVLPDFGLPPVRFMEAPSTRQNRSRQPRATTSVSSPLRSGASTIRANKQHEDPTSPSASVVYDITSSPSLSLEVVDKRVGNAGSEDLSIDLTETALPTLHTRSAQKHDSRTDSAGKLADRSARCSLTPRSETRPRTPEKLRLRAADEQRKADARQRKADEKQRKEDDKQRKRELSAANAPRKGKTDWLMDLTVKHASSMSSPSVVKSLREQLDPFQVSFESDTTQRSDTLCFRRRISAEYDSEQDCFVPLSEATEANVPGTVWLLTAERASKYAQNRQTLFTDVLAIRNQDSGRGQVYCLLSGWTNLMRKAKAALSRELMDDGATSRRTCDYSTEELDNLLLDMQIDHNIQIIHANIKDVAEVVYDLACELSALHTLESRAALMFCTESGQFKTGTDTRDTFERMLCAVPRVPPRAATSIAATFRSLSTLTVALEDRGPPALSSISLAAAALQGSDASGSTIGQALAQSITRYLLADNPDVEA